MIKVKRALISVSDKKGIIPFVKGLHSLGIEIISTGGTAKQLKEADIPVCEVSEYTKSPEMLDGRVKTLHPKIHGGLLALRHNQEHMAQIKEHDIGLIDMVVVNLYPFETVIKKKSITLEEATENIDIGGPSMLRSAAKNYKSVAVICNPDRYKQILDELETNSGLLSDFILYQLAIEAFGHTARYDRIIFEYLNNRLKGESFSRLSQEMSFRFIKVQDLRYGENPQQQAAFYRQEDEAGGMAHLKQLHGKELSFNNILDLNAAVSMIKDLRDPAAVIIKHNNPTGLAEDKTLCNAYRHAWCCDPVSAFGGIIGLNRKLDLATAQIMQSSGFMECVIAAGFEQKAFKLLSQKKNLRLIEFDFKNIQKDGFDLKKVYGGLLIQETDERDLKESEMRVVTKKAPTKAQLEAMLFGWKAIKNIKSNAIVLVKQRRLVGIGCGQTSRVESVRTAIAKAGSNSKNTIMVSDAFLPHVDNVQLAAKAGVKAIIQTGGSVADSDVIKQADKSGMAMVMTGVRHFKH